MSKASELLQRHRLAINEEQVFVSISLPLLIRLFEYSREDAPNDEALHFLTERASQKVGNLTMDDYNYLTSGNDYDQDGDDDSSSYSDTDQDSGKLDSDNDYE
jgi:hypothetical protein